MMELQQETVSGRHYLVAGLFVVFSFLMLFSMAITRIAPVADLSQYNPTVFNLFYYVPLSLWVGLFGLCGLFLYLFSGPKGFSIVFVNVLLFLIMMLILFVFFGLPYLVEPNPRFVDSWIHGKVAKIIFEGASLVPSRNVLYLSYPLSFSFLSVLSMVSGTELTVLLRFLPLGLILVFFVSLTLMFKKIVDDYRISIVASFVFALSTFYLAFHFSPEIFGWIFFLLLISFLAKQFSQFRTDGLVSKFDTVIIMLLLIGIALTHPVTQFTVIFLLTTLVILGAITRKRYVNSSLLFFAAIIFVSWAIHFATVYFEVIVEGFQNAFETIIRSLSSSIAARALAAPTPVEVAGLELYRRILYGITPLLAFLGGVLYYRRNKASVYFLSSFLIVGLFMMPFTVFGILPLERPIKLVFIPLALFAAIFICSKKKLGVFFLAFLLFTIPINFAACYWGEADTMTHDWEVAAAKFVGDNFHGILLGNFKIVGVMDYYGNFSAIYDDYSLVGERPNIFNVTFIMEHHVEAVCITQLTLRSAQALGIEIDLDSFWNSRDFSCVYSNGYSYVFVREDTAT